MDPATQRVLDAVAKFVELKELMQDAYIEHGKIPPRMQFSLDKATTDLIAAHRAR